MAESWVALMRGINVGGKNRIRMAELSGCFEEIGCSEVRSYIQSGNIVFRATAEVAETVPRAIPKGIEARLGFAPPVVVRRGSDFVEAVESNPFLEEAADPKHLHIGFLAAAPSPEALESLDPDRSTVDRFLVRGSEVYLHVPGGLARTKLTTAYFDRRLDTVMTVRNWRTAGKIVEMLKAGSSHPPGGTPGPAGPAQRAAPR